MARAGERRPDVALVDIRIKGRLDGIKTAQLLRGALRRPDRLPDGPRGRRDPREGHEDAPLRLSPEARQGRRAAERDRDAPSTGTRPSRAGRIRGAPPGDRAPWSSTREAPAAQARAVRRAARADPREPRFRRAPAFAGVPALHRRGGPRRPRGGDHPDHDRHARSSAARTTSTPSWTPSCGSRRAACAARSRGTTCSPASTTRSGSSCPRGTYVPAFRSVNAVEAPATEALRHRPRPRASAPEPTVGRLALARVTGSSPQPERQRCRSSRSRRAKSWPSSSAATGPFACFGSAKATVGSPLAADRARFALGGRVRQEGDGLRVSARLVDRTTGEQVWGDEYRTAPAARAVERLPGRRRPRHRRPRRRPRKGSSSSSSRPSGGSASRP